MAALSKAAAEMLAPTPNANGHLLARWHWARMAMIFRAVAEQTTNMTPRGACYGAGEARDLVRRDAGAKKMRPIGFFAELLRRKQITAREANVYL